jgi:hypothetical protein
MVVLGEKLDTNPRIGQPSCYGLCREHFFSGAVALVDVVYNTLTGTITKAAHYGSLLEGLRL